MALVASLCEAAHRLVWSPDGKELLLVTARELVLFDPASGRARVLHLRGVSAAAFSRRDGSAVVQGEALLVFDGEQARTVSDTWPARWACLVAKRRWLLTALLPPISGFRRREARACRFAHRTAVRRDSSLDGWVAGP